MATSKRATRSTRKLLEWTVEQVESGRFPGLIWDDPPAKTMFRIPWKHAGKQEFRHEEDAGFFKAWAIFKGKYRPGENNPAAWKTRIRCALSKSPEFEHVPERSRLDIAEPYKVYRLVPISEQVVVKKPKPPKPGQINKSKECASSRDQIPQPMDSLLTLKEEESVTPEAQSAHQSREPSPHPGEPAPDVNEITLRLNPDPSPAVSVADGSTGVAPDVNEVALRLNPDPSPAVSVADGSTGVVPDVNEIALRLNPDPSPAVNVVDGSTGVAEFSICLSICCTGELIQKYLLPEGEFLITSVAASPNAPLNCMKRVVLPNPSKITDPAKKETIQRLLKDLERGVMVATNHEGIFIQCRSKVCIYCWGSKAAEGVKKLENNTYLKLFSPREFKAALQQYQLGLAPLPEHRITLCMGEDLGGNENVDSKPIIIQMEQIFALRLLSSIISQQ